jgi:putative peptidoglycan lipid II flippase
MLRNFFNNQSKTIAAAAFILGAASLISRALGLIRDRILAGQFGAGDELDIYYAAFRIPDLIYSIVVLGALSAGFIPVFINYLRKDKPQAWALANNIFNLLAVGLITLCLLAILLTPWLVKIIAPGFSGDKLSSTAELTRIMFLSPLFLGLSTVLGGILRSFKRFLAYALAPVMYNLGIIFGALFLVRPFGLVGLAYGVVLGALLHFLIQLPTAYLCGFRWRPRIILKSPGAVRILRLMPPQVLNLSLTQINLWAMTVFASFLMVGSVAIFNLSMNIWSFPLGVFGISFILATFPRLSDFAQQGNRASFVKSFSYTFRQILFFILPISVLFIVLREQIVKVILNTGQFDQQDALLTFETLSFFCVSLFAEALILLCLRGFFAWEDTLTPFLIGLLATSFRLAVAWILSKQFGVPGLAMGFSLGSLFYFILLFVSLRNKIGFLDSRRLGKYSLKILSASLVSGLGAYLGLVFLSAFLSAPGILNIFLNGFLAGLFGIIIYLLLARLLKIKELKLFLIRLWGK